MLSKKLRLALPIAAAAVMTAVIPAGTAHAIDRVNCGPSDYLKVDVHFEGVSGWVDTTYCFANRGVYDFTWDNRSVWVDKIDTGNNRVKYYDHNGAVVTYSKNFIITFPNNPPLVDRIEIL
ncbi:MULTISPECIES: beta/gamma crystallin domain-containing protein [unclassified Streptomyces]|uniref:beta/gamma crystallin domain-containing protein n=1 Tax=unclassified Streptomyces TaxID=2593676 RepID=UPI0004C016C5|nr:MULTISPECIES: beta/gamma crystallin domain-containing protein [unclassified Streptomyces]